MIIYSITHRESGKRYIGQTGCGLKRRWELHRNYAKRSSQDAIHRAIRKHGESAFDLREEARCGSKEHMNEMERFFIRLFETKGERGYNMTSGGVGTPDHAVSVAARRKMSQVNIGRTPWNKGKKLPEVSSRMMGNKNGIHNRGNVGGTSWNKGKPMSDDYREACRVRASGRKASQDTRKKMSDARRGRKLSAETIEKLRGRKISEDTRIKQRAAATLREKLKREARNVRS